MSRADSDSCSDPGMIRKTFPVWSRARTHGDVRNGRECGRFAVDIAGGVLPPFTPVEHFAEDFGQAAVKEADVFVHMLVTSRTDAADLGITLENVFGESLRAAEVEVYDTELVNHITHAYNGNGTGIIRFLGQHAGRVPDRMLSMWRNIFLASVARQKYSLENGCRYSVVVRSRPDINIKPFDFAQWKAHVANNPDTVVIGCHASLALCRERAAHWPNPCWLDDQLAIGSADAVSAYERLFPDLARFAWWWPYEIRSAKANFPERLMLAHMDWRARAARAGSHAPFSWSMAGLDGKPLMVLGIEHSHNAHVRVGEIDDGW